MPAKTILVRQRYALWINDEICILIEKREINSHKKAKLSNREADWRKLRDIKKSDIGKVSSYRN